MSKVKFVYVRREDGSQPALEFIASIVQKARQGHPYFNQMVIEIRNGIKAIEKAGIPPWNLINEQPFYVETPTGISVKFELLKRLEYNFPLVEFRVNVGSYPKGYAFRMVLFTHYYQGTEYVFVTNAMIKRQTSSVKFDEMVKEATEIYKDFRQNPNKYYRMGDSYE
ncbi:hypothetical protein [Thermoactinomyces sp. CICC 10522]|uniref:hypothetical protein n=1 Tax=Thermoactinomyces sp. CICC 10522 TaxID=2767427 RepID=UPI0018DD3930|nr:hypothetical protein [Thermoactinomyces sp. CICC 10522]MBH8605853.1 hypothetical protein [Thermoactinomyces sp. CICC 10522]